MVRTPCRSRRCSSRTPWCSISAFRESTASRCAGGCSTTCGATRRSRRRTRWTSSCRTCDASWRPRGSRGCCTRSAEPGTCCARHEAPAPAAGSDPAGAHLREPHVRDPAAVRHRDRRLRRPPRALRVRRRAQGHRGGPPAEAAGPAVDDGPRAPGRPRGDRGGHGGRRRAMAPIAGLTRAAGHIARTRDPAVELPKPEADDEVADLASTLEDMLRALDAARAETEGALSRQREFVADASHELRTPLTSILANLELLEAELRGEQREMASSALRSSRRMRRLVADLLLLARADAGRGGLRENVDLARVVGEAAAEAAPVVAGHGLTIDLPNGDTRGPIVEGVSDDLHRLALNLIENALAHTPPGTDVRVRLSADGDVAVLEVDDAGPGIPPDMRERIFDRFVRGPGDSGGGGSGLGLAIVRAVTEQHGGSVEVAASEAGGARFVLRLPAVPVRAPLTPLRPPAAPSADAC